ncbi:MAG: peptidase S8 [Candidatus Sericytochromatia bacterium]|nr:peptidase S8 [Candidatus Sericytochromatia bacterium]
MRHWILAGLLAVTTACGSITTPLVAFTGRERTSAANVAAPTQVIVKFRSAAAGRSVSEFMQAQGARTLSRTSSTRATLVTIQGDPQLAVQRFQQSGLVDYAEPNYKVKGNFTANDPKTGGPGGQYGLAVVQVDKAWNLTLGDPRVIIGVVDTGADLTHPDLIHQFVPGYNVVSKGATPPKDDNGHGTHASGAVAAEADNGIGVAGVAPRCKLMPVKALDAKGEGYTYDIAEGIYWAVDHGAKVINLSLGGRGASQALRDAVDYALSKRVNLVAAMGNGDESGVGQNWPTFPAAYPGVISVGAVDADRRVTEFSNFGSWISIVAPGQDIMSTMPTYPVYQTTTASYQQNYDAMSGTSMASPMVAGVVALMLSRYPAMTPAQVKAKIEQSARHLGDAGFNDHYGYGVVDAFKAVM